MKLKFIFIISIFSLGPLLSQVNKTIFYNENIQEISEKQFYKKKNNKTNLALYFESDSIISSVLVKRKNKGKIND